MSNLVDIKDAHENGTTHPSMDGKRFFFAKSKNFVDLFAYRNSAKDNCKIKEKEFIIWHRELVSMGIVGTLAPSDFYKLILHLQV